MIARLALLYLAIFIVVLAALSAVAYIFVAQIYAGELQPALGTAEYHAVYASAMRHVAFSIAALDAPLLFIVGLASYLLARTSIAPLLAATERERQFAADAAHELRSPLATIATVAQAAQGEDVTAAHHALDTISKAALEASELIGDLLTLARAPRPAALHCEPVDLGAIAQACAAEMETSASGRGITVQVTAASAIVNGDERRLKELTRNLIENALHHARTVINVATKEDAQCGYLTVSDDGAGVPEALREKIFGRFYRVSDDGRGTGLGLSISQWIARAHGGTLSLQNGVHTEFVASFPLFR